LARGSNFWRLKGLSGDFVNAAPPPSGRCHTIVRELLADRILVFTLRPGRIAADIEVDLPRPRTPQSAPFAALARELRELIGAEDRDFD
jgi:hypothetical protein